MFIWKNSLRWNHKQIFFSPAKTSPNKMSKKCCVSVADVEKSTRPNIQEKSKKEVSDSSTKSSPKQSIHIVFSQIKYRLEIEGEKIFMGVPTMFVERSVVESYGKNHLNSNIGLFYWIFRIFIENWNNRGKIFMKSAFPLSYMKVLFFNL